MVLECVMLCCDNSEFMRNGDYQPTRLHAQQECVHYISQIKTDNNPETFVGALTMAGKRIEMLLPPSRDLGKLMTAMTLVKTEGKCNFIAGLKTAALALKNRENKKQRQRIIAFVGSPLQCSADELTTLAKAFKKSNVSVDIINFGDENTENDNREKLVAFINAVNKEDTSRLVNVPPGPHNLSDMVLSTIMQESGSAPAGAVPAGGGAAANMAAFGGVDPNLDPELAAVLRASYEEEQERQRLASAASAPAPAATTTSAPPALVPDVEMDDEALLAQAIAMSMEADAMEVDSASSAPAQTSTPAPSTTSASSSDQPAAISSDDVSAALQDKDFIDSLLDSLPGVDKNEIDIDELRASLNPSSSSSSAPEKKDDKKNGQQ